MSNRSKLLVAALVCIALGILGTAFVWQAVQPDHGRTTSRTSEESTQLNNAYLNYVRMNNPELDSVDNGRLLYVGYRMCEIKNEVSPTAAENVAETGFPGAGRRIYDGAIQYLC